MNECIFKIKQQKFRERIRKSKIEEMFRLKRNMASFSTYSCKLHQVYLNFQNNLEMQSQIAIQCDLAMQELVNKNNTHDSLLQLVNLCASQNLSNITILVEKFKLHQVFLEILQQKSSFSWQIDYALQGLMNILISDFESPQILIMLLDSNLITIIIKIKQKVDDKFDVSKETLLKLILVVLCKISYLNCQNHITKPQLIDLFALNIDLFSEQQEYCCLNIIIICEYLEGLLGLISEQKFFELLNLVKITYINTEKLTLRMLIMIIKLMSSFDANCNNCLKLIKQSTIFEFFELVFQRNKTDELLIEHCLLFLNDILSYSSEVLPQCLGFLQPFLQLTVYTESLTILVLCSQTLAYLVEKQTILQLDLPQIISAQFHVLRKLSNGDLEEETLMALETLLKLCEQGNQIFSQQQIEFLEKIKQSDNSDIREVVSSILCYEFNNV